MHPPATPSAPPGPRPTALPPGPLVDGVPPWRRIGTAAWSAARPGRWARPLWSVLALLVSVVAAFATEPVPVCGDANPCGPDWIDPVQTGLAIGVLCWNARLPELTLVAAPPLAFLVAAEQFPAPGTASAAANAAVLAALGLCWAAACDRLAARRRQRRAFERASGAVLRTLGPTGLPVRGKSRLIGGTVLCAVAVTAALLGLRGVHADEDRAARATRIEAEVTSHTEESVRLRAHDGRRLVVDSLFPEDHRLGSTVTVLEDGSWRRLAAEPYDAFGWQLLALVTAVPGISLVVAGARALHRSSARRRGGLAALRVRVVVDGEGMAWVQSPDEAGVSEPLPLFVVDTVSWTVLDGEDEGGLKGEDEGGLKGEGEEEGEGGEDGIADGDDVEPLAFGSLREAVLIGAPYEGAETVLVLPTGDDTPHPTVLLATARLMWGERRIGRVGRGGRSVSGSGCSATG
ncbi:hypothetical protein [Streptomyces sp. NPDC085479]|uniref:hypothetical protein n=1 Tax=Streptomyces sp. NPDC085479 TaxID=3365726 RepID=UPI0037D370F8